MATVKERPGVQTEQSPVRDATTPPTRSWWKTNRKWVVPLALVAIGLPIVAVVGVMMSRGRDNVPAALAPAAAAAPEAAPVAAPGVPVASASSADKPAPAAPVAAEQKPAARTKGFTPGTYTLEQVKQFSIAECQSDAAKAVACYETFVYLGDVERARTVLAHGDPAATRVITHARESWQVLTKDGSKLVGFKIYGLDRYPEKGMIGRMVEPAGNGPFVPGKYSATVDYLGEPKDVLWARGLTGMSADLFLGGDGKWLNAPRVPN